jgi:hypothetical protein
MGRNILFMLNTPLILRQRYSVLMIAHKRILKPLTLPNKVCDGGTTDGEMAIFTHGRDFNVLSSRTNVALCSTVVVGRDLKRTEGNQSFVAIEG